jgi:hypothetical protein
VTVTKLIFENRTIFSERMNVCVYGGVEGVRIKKKTRDMLENHGATKLP